MADERSPYRRLGVAEGATREQVRIAYLNLARSLHPDRLIDASDAERRLAERRMREVNDAYETIQRGGPAGPRVESSPPSRSAPRPPPRRPAEPDPWDDDVDGPEVAPWDEDDVELHPATVFLLRRGPLIAVLVVAAFLFFASAYAGGPSDPPATGPTTTCVGPPPTAIADGETITLPC